MKLKAFLWEIAPRDWKALVIGLLCIASGMWNMEQAPWYNHVAAVVVLVMAGVSIYASVIGPKFKELGQRLDKMTQKLKDFQPESAGKRAAEAFRQEILDMQARGELPPDAQIVFEVPGQKPPPGRLN